MGRIDKAARHSEQALEWLERGFEVHAPGLPYLDLPVYDPPRSNQHFQDLRHRMNLPVS